MEAHHQLWVSKGDRVGLRSDVRWLCHPLFRNESFDVVVPGIVLISGITEFNVCLLFEGKFFSFEVGSCSRWL